MVGPFPVLMWVDLLVSAVWVCILLLNISQLMTVRKYELKGASEPTGEPLSVIIPARNEERRISQSVMSVLRQSERSLEAIVVNDRSIDNTAQVVERMIHDDDRVVLVKGEPLPEGWKGKPWACHQGYMKARSDWLLFIDSDTVLEDHAVATAMSFARKNSLEAVSFVPRIELDGFRAKVITPVLSAMIRLFYPLSAVNDPRRGAALVIGGFLLIDRRAYERIGGHVAVKSVLVEDKQLGTNLKEKGVPFRLMLGKKLVTVGLFTGGQGIWNSVRRTVSSPLSTNRRTTLMFAAGLLFISCFPVFAFVAGLATGESPLPISVPLLISAAVPALVVVYDAAGVKDSSLSYALLAVVGGVVISLAIIRQRSGSASVRWRGRTY